MTRMIRAGNREFELPPFALGDRVLWTPAEWRDEPNVPRRLPATIVGINLLGRPASLRLWFDEDVKGLANGLVNGFKCSIEEVEPMSAVERLAKLAPAERMPGVVFYQPSPLTLGGGGGNP